MNLDLLINLLKEVHEFELSSSYKTNCTVEDFRLYLNEKAYQNDTPQELNNKLGIDIFKIENEIAKETFLLGRYAKILVKKAMENHPELVSEDFTYLFRLMNYESLTKTQLIEKNAHEKQTGIEIIKRLVKNGLIEENPDETDKRSVRINVSEKGKKVFFESMNDVSSVSKIMCAKLTDEEKQNLLTYLKKLNGFHHNVYLNFRNENLGEIKKML